MYGAYNFCTTTEPLYRILNVATKLVSEDNLTYDAARVIGVLGALMYVMFWIVQVAVTRHFTPGDADAYGRGLGVVLLAMAGALAIKSNTEPERK